jgi:hypothetical protein
MFYIQLSAKIRQAAQKEAGPGKVLIKPVPKQADDRSYSKLLYSFGMMVV